jgi:hypothetical protein
MKENIEEAGEGPEERDGTAGAAGTSGDDNEMGKWVWEEMKQRGQ